MPSKILLEYIIYLVNSYCNESLKMVEKIEGNKNFDFAKKHCNSQIINKSIMLGKKTIETQNGEETM